MSVCELHSTMQENLYGFFCSCVQLHFTIDPTQKEAKIAYDEYMNNYSKSAIKTNSTMSYQEFYETYFEPDYKRSVGQSTFDNRVSAMRLHFSYFYKRKLKEINAPMIKKWQNQLSEKYSNAYI